MTLTISANTNIMSMELKNSSVFNYAHPKADNNRPRQYGGFFMSMLRGDCEYVQGENLKSQLLISFGWVLNPRNMTPLRRHIVPAILTKGTNMTQVTNPTKTPEVTAQDREDIKHGVKLLQYTRHTAERLGISFQDAVTLVINDIEGMVHG